METKNRKRLSDLSTIERLDFYKFVAENKDKPNLLDLIEDNFGIRYKQGSLRYIRKISLYTSYVEQIHKDNVVMNRWRKEYESDDDNKEDTLLTEMYETARVKGYLKGY
jgi:hypothetical protein